MSRLEARATADRRAVRRMVVVAFLAFDALSAWAAVTELDVVARAEGEVKPSSHVRAVQHLDGGIVEEIMVEEGEVVALGQPLVRLDTVRASAEHDELSIRLASLRLDMLRLETELAGGTVLAIPEELRARIPSLADAAEQVFSARRARRVLDREVQESLIVQREEELRELAARITGTGRGMEALREQVGISADLLRRDLRSRLQHLQLVREEEALRGQIEVDRATRPRIEAALREARERLQLMDQTFALESLRELVEARRAFDELSERIVKYAQAEAMTTLRAPVAGVVKRVGVTTAGGIVRAGETIFEIVPLDDRLIVEARLPVTEIGFVHPGQEARIALTVPSGARISYVDGTVKVVSADRLVSEDGGTFYRVLIDTGGNAFEQDGRSHRLYPGMRVVCLIRIGQRTVADYLLGYFLSPLGFGFREL